MTRLVVRLAVAAFLAATVGLGVPGAAQAATCSTAHGVTVVVDFHQLGNGVETSCDLAGAGRTAATQFTDVGHTLTYAQRQPGFVCRVDGSPSSDPCVNTSPADAYWSLWWSDGKSGTWSFSSQGVASLTVPEGGYVAFSWQGGGSKAEPRVTPKAHPTASPTPTSSPTHPTSSATSDPTTAPPTSPTTGSSTTPPSGGSTASGPSATALGNHRHGSGTHRHGHHVTATPTRSSTGSDPSSVQAEAGPATAVDSGHSGLPGWIAPGLVAVLFVSAATVAVVRRKRPGGP